jgi:hypothetical protein
MICDAFKSSVASRHAPTHCCCFAYILLVLVPCLCRGATGARQPSQQVPHHYDIRKPVCKAAYLVLSGNFRHAWIRFGFDPRAHPCSLMYQTFECRFTPLKNKRYMQAFGRPVGGNPTAPGVATFVLARWRRYQILDVYRTLGVDKLAPVFNTGKGCGSSPIGSAAMDRMDSHGRPLDGVAALQHAGYSLPEGGGEEDEGTGDSFAHALTAAHRALVVHVARAVDECRRTLLPAVRTMPAYNAGSLGWLPDVSGLLFPLWTKCDRHMQPAPLQPTPCFLWDRFTWAWG